MENYPSIRMGRGGGRCSRVLVWFGIVFGLLKKLGMHFMKDYNNMYFHSLQMHKQVTSPFSTRVDLCLNYILLVALIIQKAEVS